MRVLHLSHHDGCIADFEYVASRLGLTLRSYRYDDGYNIGPERADRSWQSWRERFEAADVVLISDTAPLARILFQHLDEYPGHVVVWVCNRFDYADQATNDCDFPDPAYYELVRAATMHPRVRFASYTPFERHYARTLDVDLGDRVIKPVGRTIRRSRDPVVPADIDKPASVFVPPYHNDTLLMDLAGRCQELGVTAYSGRYGGPDDLRGFKAVVHIPYAWSNFAFFEHLQNGIPIHVPAPRLLLQLARKQDFFWPQAHMLRRYITLSEWYSPEHDFVVRFDSWRSLRRNLRRLDQSVVQEQMVAFAAEHTRSMLGAWDRLFDGIEAAR